MMSEIDYLMLICDKLDVLNDRIETIIIILVIYTVIHYLEKWFKMLISKDVNK